MGIRESVVRPWRKPISTAWVVVFLGLPLAALVSLGSASAAQEGTPAQLSDSNTLRETAERLRASLHASGVPTQPLESKLEEGLAKSIPAPMLILALERVAADLTWLHQTFDACRNNRPPEDRRRMLSVGGDLLLSGVSRDRMTDLLGAVCARDDLEGILSRVGELYFYLTGRLRADPSDTWRFCGHVARRRAPRAALDRVVLVLQDIYRQRGSISGALSFAVSRIERGTTLRTLRDELRERYLRH